MNSKLKEKAIEIYKAIELKEKAIEIVMNGPIGRTNLPRKAENQEEGHNMPGYNLA